MGLVTRPLFSDAWVDGVRHGTEAAMTAEITVYTADRTYNDVTDTWAETTTTVYLGKARVQPIRAAYREVRSGDTTSIQNVQISIPVAYVDTPLAVGQQMRVLNGGLNPQLTEYEFVVSDIVEPSALIDRTFFCTVNQEVRV